MTSALTLMSAAPLSLSGISTAHAAGCAWVGSSASPDAKADQVIAAMSVSDEVNLVTGTGGSYTGNIAANPALCIPALNLMDGPAGVRAGGTTQLPAPVAGAASFDAALEQQYGTVVGQEVAGKGGNVSLGPTVNIVRDPRWGRAFESFSEDPYLAAKMTAAEITGVQNQGVMAQVKHLAAYNQESNRQGTNPPDDAILDTRNLQETYLQAFQAAADAKVASVMCAYNQVTNSTPGNETDWACENNYLQNTVLKGQMGFPGFVTSDWGATHSTAKAAINGLDMEMPSGTYFGTNLVNAVNSGQVPKSRLDDMAHRILREMFGFGLFDKAPSGSVDAVVTSPAHTATALQVAEEGAVLLKNSGNALPLTSSTHSIAVIGQDAGSGAMSAGGGSAGVNPSHPVIPWQDIASRAAKSGASVNYVEGPTNDGSLPSVPSSALTPSSGGGSGLTASFYNNTTLSGAPALNRNDSSVDFNWGGGSPATGIGGSNWSAKWTGTLTPSATGTYMFSTTSDDGSRLIIGGQTVVDNWADQASTTKTGTISLTAGQPVSIELDYYQKGGGSNLSLGWQVPGTPPLQQAVDAAKSSDVAVVFAGYGEGEGGDRGDINLSANDNNVIAQVAAANPHTVVVLNTGSAVTMPWLSQVAGVFEAWYPGQEEGGAIAALLFGDASPSGKLPVTFPNSLSDAPDNTSAQWTGSSNGQVQYSEGEQIGYRWYDAQNKTPLFPFGYGLSYTTFGFSNLNVTGPDSSGTVTATATVTNTGSKAGSEVAQLYLSSPATAGEPPKRLKGFSRVTLNPGASTTATFTLSTRDYQSWSTATNDWITPNGTYTVSVGDSSRNLPLTGTFTANGVAPSGETVAGVAANLCLDDRAASTADGNPIQIYACNGTGAQVVTVAPDSSDSTHTADVLQILGKCVDIQGGGSNNGTLVQLYGCNQSGAQRWVPRPDGSLKNPQSNRCLDDPGATLTQGTQLIIWDCNGGNNQRWRIP